MSSYCWTTKESAGPQVPDGLEPPVVLGQRRLGVERQAPGDVVVGVLDRQGTGQGAAQPVHVPGGQVGRGRADHAADLAVAHRQPGRDVVGEEGGLARARRAVDHQVFLVRAGQQLDHLLRRLDLPGVGDPPEVAALEVAEVVQCPLGLLPQLVSDEGVGHARQVGLAAEALLALAFEHRGGRLAEPGLGRRLGLGLAGPALVPVDLDLTVSDAVALGHADILRGV